MSSVDQSQKYTVYDNRTDTPVAVCATAKECAKAMGVKLDTFHHHINGSRGNRWIVVKEGLCEEFQKPKTVGEYMRKCRVKKGLTRPQLAELSGVAKTTIVGYEMDLSFPGILNLISIADALDVTIDELVGRKVK